MAVTALVFTGDVSAPVEFSGAVKIVCAGMTEGQHIMVQEENSLGGYQNVNTKNGSLMIWGGEPSNIFYLLGSHKIIRSSSNIEVGYVLS